MEEVLKIVVEGCCHGELDNIYKSILSKPNIPELLIICGDFQALRNKDDLKCMAVPDKYKKLGSFHEYYTGELVAPILTIFVGGNHEASNYLKELKYGGWVAPNIYYLGDFGVIWYKGVRIGGLSGIWNKHNFLKKETESIPYDSSDVRSVYHIRAVNYMKMYLLNNSGADVIDDNKLDIMVTHDWPRSIQRYGNLAKLIKQKRGLQSDIETNELGNPCHEILLHRLKPLYWFSAHLHVRFTANVVHEASQTSPTIISHTKKKIVPQEAEIHVSKRPKLNNEDEIVLDIDDCDPVSDNKDRIELDLDEPEPVNENEDEIELDLSDGDEEEAKSTKNKYEISIDRSKGTKYVHQGSKGEAITSDDPLCTQFLSLDKCLPKRKFLEFMNIPIRHTTNENPKGLYYDKRSIAINKIFNSYSQRKVFDKISYNDYMELDIKKSELVQELMREIDLEIGNLNKLKERWFKIPENFVETAPGGDIFVELKTYINPQTTAYIEKFLV